MNELRSLAVGNFDKEAVALITVTCITLVIVILRAVFAIWLYTIKKENEWTKWMRRQSLSLQKVTVVNDNKKHNSKEKNSSSISKTWTQSSLDCGDVKYETVMFDTLADRNIDIHPSIKYVQSKMTQSNQKRIDDDESFWCHSLQESEKSMEYANIPQTSAYGMRKIGKKKYIDDTNIGSPRSKALEQKSCEQMETPKRKHDEKEDKS